MDPNFEASKRIGTTLRNKWTLERLIGTGGMAAVYVGAHKIGRREAIKILHPEIAAEPELRERFEQEAEAVNRFKHPGVVEIRDIDVAEDGAPFLVMELLEGESLYERAKRQGGIPLPELLRFIDELLDVLVAAHGRGIVHRDIKPDNLFITKEGKLKVLDFGIARVRAETPTRLRTKAGATLGTAPYMPPEQIRGQEIDGRADLFAVGATMFRLIAKRRIHETNNETEQLVKMASEPAPPLSSVSPETPQNVGLVVDRALRFDKADRYPDAATMQADVRAVRDGKPPPYAIEHLRDPVKAPGDASAKPSATSAGAPPPSAYDPTVAASGLEPRPVSPPTARSEAATRAIKPTHRDDLDSMEEPLPTASTNMLVEPVDSTPRSGLAVAPTTVATPVGAGETQKMEGPPPSHAAPVYVFEPHHAKAPKDPAPASAKPVFPGSMNTQPSGMAPFVPPVIVAPGGTIPVVEASHERRRSDDDEGRPNLIPLILVGVFFGALGIGLTLYFTLKSGPEPAASATPAASDTAEPAETSRSPLRPPRGPTRPTAARMAARS